MTVWYFKNHSKYGCGHSLVSDFLRRQVKEWRETHALVSLIDSPKSISPCNAEKFKFEDKMVRNNK